MAVTPEQARAELARRELARRGVPLEVPSKQSLLPSEQRIADRPSAIADLAKDPTTLGRFKKHPLGTTLRTLGGANEYFQGVPSSIGLDVQRGDYSKIPENIMKVVTGKRPAQFGDVYKGAGLPNWAANTVGLATDVVLAPGGAFATKQAVSKSTDPIKQIMKYSKSKNRMTLVDDVYNKYMQYRKDLTDIFGGEYEKIVGQSKNRVNLMNPVGEWFQDHGVNIMNNQDFKNAFKMGNPTANKIYKLIQGITNPNSKINFNDVSVEDADSFRKYIEDLPGIRSKLKLSFKKGKGMVDFTNDERVLLDLAKRIKGEVIDNEPMLGGLNQFYAQGKSDINLFRQTMLGSNKVITQKNLRKYHSDPNLDFTRESAERILGKDTIKKIKEFNDAEKNWELIKKLTGVGVAGAGLDQLYGGGAVRKAIFSQ